MESQRGHETSRTVPAAAAPAPTGAVRSLPAQRRRKSEPRPVPELREAYAHLSVEALRDYRQALTDEENRVSYWRRLLQGRLDVVAGGGSGALASHARLGTMLTRERVSAGRSALATVVPADEIPPLPQLAELWERQSQPGDDVARDRLLADLRDAEAQLSAYRSALHTRIGEATGELIARYRAEPALCLSALPQPRSATGE